MDTLIILYILLPVIALYIFLLLFSDFYYIAKRKKIMKGFSRKLNGRFIEKIIPSDTQTKQSSIAYGWIPHDLTSRFRIYNVIFGQFEDEKIIIFDMTRKIKFHTYGDFNWLRLGTTTVINGHMYQKKNIPRIIKDWYIPTDTIERILSNKKPTDDVSSMGFFSDKKAQIITKNAEEVSKYLQRFI